MDARFHSAGRWLFLPAVLLCLWALTAQAITRTPFSFVPEHLQKPAFSSRLEKDVPRQESPSLLVVLYISPDGRIGIFCGGDPIDFFDSDGRLGKGFYQTAENAVVGTASLLWNLYSAASLADDPNAAIDEPQATQGLQNTVNGLTYLGGQALQGNFGTVGTALTGGPNQTDFYRAGSATASIALLFGGELGEAGDVGESATVAETGTQAAEQGTVAAEQASGNAGLLTAPQQPATLYHYTSAENAESIMQNGLQPGASGQVFTTPTGTYTPIEAQMYLGLSPNQGLPGALFEIDTATLQEMGISPSAGPMSVLPTPNAMGYGTETIFNQPIPPAALRQIR